MAGDIVDDKVAEDYGRLAPRAAKAIVEDVAAVCRPSTVVPCPAVFCWAGGVQRPVQDDLDDVIGYLIIEVAAKRPAEPVLILVKA